MKAICTSVLLFISLGMAAQSNLVEFPYNPDADGNDIIGTADLMMLLSIFGDEFSEEGLYLSEDSTSALLYMGQHTYQSCFHTCSQLPGNWRVTDIEGLHFAMDDLNEIALEGWSAAYTVDYKHLHTWVIDRMLKSLQWLQFDSQFSRWELEDINGARSNLFDEHRCYCSVQERPKVEYSVCSQELQSDFLDCCQSKVSEGWYPLNSNPKQSQGSYWNQPFWRWAD